MGIKSGVKQIKLDILGFIATFEWSVCFDTIYNLLHSNFLCLIIAMSQKRVIKKR